MGFYRNAAGLLSFDCFGAVVHLGVKRQHRQWGRDESWHDGPLYSFGIGPLILVVW